MPIALLGWIESHRALLKPPVCNRLVFEENGFYIMVVGGPNLRKDFHYEEGPEFFYQVHGDMILRVVEDQSIREIPIREGEIFLLPPRIPHSPQRPADTVGLVIERRRLPTEQDGLQWYCEQCHHKLYEVYFPLCNVETDFPPAFASFYANTQAHLCTRCGHRFSLAE
jgi:3-hydroxyanthranilate 3,4-dioxygenase